MKKTTLILFGSLLLIGSARAQWQQGSHGPLQDKSRIRFDHPSKIHFPGNTDAMALFDNIKPGHLKGTTWKWNSYIAYDTLDNAMCKETRVFDTSGNVLTLLHQDWQLGSWQDYWRYTYTYDADGNWLTLLSEQSQLGVWKNSMRVSCTYDTNGNPLTQLVEYWQGGSWVTNFRYINTYNTNGDPLIYLLEVWSGGAWETNERFVYIYDINGYLLNFIDELWSGSAWDNSQKHTYTNDLSGNRLTDLYEYWNGSAWVNADRKTYTYDAFGTKQTRLDETWSGGAWHNEWRYNYTYDTDTNFVLQLKEQWQNSNWTTNARLTYTYDIDQNSTEGISEVWQNGLWKPGYSDPLYLYVDHTELHYVGYVYRYVATYTSSFGISFQAGDDALLKLYPNPSSDFFSVEMPLLKASSDAVISIYSLHGQMLFAQRLQQPVSRINITGIDKGLYIVMISCDDIRFVKKLIKE
jgi:hypothetical protein